MISTDLTITPKGSAADPCYRKTRQVAKHNTSIHIGIPWEIVALADIKTGDKFKMYIDFPNKDKIVLERVKD